MTPPGPKAVFAVALLLRLAAGIALDGLTQPQLFEPDGLARSLLRGDGFVFVWHGGVPYHSFYAPLYPFVVAAMYWLGGGSTLLLMLLQMTVSSVTAALVTHLGRRVFSPLAGAAAGLLTAIHPGLILNAASNVHELTFDVLAFTAVVWCWIRLREQLTWGRAATMGLIGGLALLERPTTAIVLAAGGIWLFFTAVDRRRAVLAVALGATCAALVIAPWTIRTWRVQDRFVFIRSTDWEVFWRGNNPNATGHSYTPTGQTVLDSLPAEDLAALRSLPDENQQADWFRDRALAYVRDQPMTFVVMTLKKWYYFWWRSPQTGILYPPWWLWGYLVYYIPVLGLALVGAAMIARRGAAHQRQVLTLLASTLLALSTLQSFYYVEGRHRWAIEPLLLLLTGAGISAVATPRAYYTVVP